MNNQLISNKYCNSLTKYSRWETREVNIGDIPLGGNNPIRVQSMTTTNTMDTISTVEQSIRMIDAGCEYVRITAPSKNEAKNLQNNLFRAMSSEGVRKTSAPLYQQKSSIPWCRLLGPPNL